MTPVILTTKHRGVFYGKIDVASPEITEATLHDAVMLIRWGTTDGVAQLAATGPTDASKLSAKVEAWHLRDVTSLLECSLAAVEGFRARTA